MRFIGTAALLFAVVLSCAAASPSASPSPSPSPGFSLSVNGSNVFIANGVGGPGLSPPEAGAFIIGLPLSPMTPYDWFTSAPTTPGLAAQFQYAFTGTERFRHTHLAATVFAGAYAGDLNMLNYWGEPWAGPLDPHEGRSPVNASVYFPLRPGERDGLAAQAVLPFSASYGSNDGSYAVSGGYFSLAQTDRFVFAPPAVTNANPSTGVQTAETLGPGMPNVDAWGNSAVTLPLFGADAIVHRGNVSAELTDALLPALQGTSARALVGSVVLDRGNAGRFSAEVANVRTSADAISTTTYFGQNPDIIDTSQGRLYTSTLGDQHQTIAGVRAFFHPRPHDDALVELGRAWYATSFAREPGTNAPGSYEHVGFTHHFAKSFDAGADYYRFDPRYATVILPYGIQENIWSIAWSWPGNWLKSTYQAVDNLTVGINREGFRARTDYTHGRLELHGATDVWRQITPMTISQAAQEGWVEGFFLPQRDDNPTLGWQRQINVYGAWHLDRDDVVLDGVWDRSYRPAGRDPIDLVDMNYPETVLSWQHHWTKKSLAVLGYGRYQADGMWSTTPVDSIYDVAFVGGEWDFSRGQQLLVQLRRYTTHGLPSQAYGPSPATRGTMLVVDHRFTL